MTIRAKVVTIQHERRHPSSSDYDPEQSEAGASSSVRRSTSRRTPPSQHSPEAIASPPALEPGSPTQPNHPAPSQTVRGTPTQATAAAPCPRSMRAVTLRKGKSSIIAPPYPWATDQRARIHNLDYLVQQNLVNIKGFVKCRACGRMFEISYHVIDKFLEIARFITQNQATTDTRAPSVWMNPTFPDCRECRQTNSAWPVMAKKKKEINWLFLMCGQMLGCCTIPQLKYFCKHTSTHRTGGKDSLLYLTYLGICKQLYPGKLSMFSGIYDDESSDQSH